MGCGSSVSQVANTLKQNQFKPLRLLQLEQEHQLTCAQGRILLLGETKTQRRIVEVSLMEGKVKPVSTRTRIPVPKVHYDPLQLMYEQSQEVFHSGVFGLSMLPPFNRMLVLYLHKNVVFMSGGVDYDSYNVRNEAFFYTLAEDAAKQQMGENSPHPLNQKAESRSKSVRNKFQKLSSMSKGRYGHMGIYIGRMKSVLVFGGMDEAGEYLNSCERYGVMENSWRQLVPMRIKRAYGSCVLYGSKIYLFGGKKAADRLTKKIEVYDLDTSEWQILPFKIHRGIEHPMVFSPRPNQLILVGGNTHSGPTASAIRIDLSTLTYIWDSQLTAPHRYPKGIAESGMALIFGGTENRYEQYFEGGWKSYPFQHRNYLTIPEMEPFSCSSQSITVPLQFAGIQNPIGQVSALSTLFGNDQYPCIIQVGSKRLTALEVPKSLKIKSKMGVCEYQPGMYFIAGGCDVDEVKHSRSCYYYDPLKNQAKETIKMTDKKYDFAICHLNGYIYVFGGQSVKEHSPLKSCARFSLEEEHWEALPALRRGRRGARAEALGDSKIAVFGGYKGEEVVRGIEVYSVSQKRFYIVEPHLRIPYIISSSADTLEQRIEVFLSEDGKNIEQMTIRIKQLEVLDSYRSVSDLNSLQTNRSSPSPQILSKGISQPLIKKNQLPALATKERNLSSRKASARNEGEQNKKQEEPRIQQGPRVVVETKTVEVRAKGAQRKEEVAEIERELKGQEGRGGEVNEEEKQQEQSNQLQIKQDLSEEMEREEKEEKVQIPLIGGKILFEMNSSRTQEPPMAPRPPQEQQPSPEGQQDNQNAPMIVTNSPPSSPSKAISKSQPIQRRSLDWLEMPARAYRRYNSIYFIQPPHCIQYDTQTSHRMAIDVTQSELISKLLL